MKQEIKMNRDKYETDITKVKYEELVFFKKWLG